MLFSLCAAYGIAAPMPHAYADKPPGGKPPAGEKPAKPDGPGKNPDCLQIRSQTPYRGYGYDHIVEIRNACDRTAICSVKTDVNPAPVEQSVPSGETRSVLMFRGSPSSAFTPTVTCKLK